MNDLNQLAIDWLSTGWIAPTPTSGTRIAPALKRCGNGCGPMPAFAAIAPVMGFEGIDGSVDRGRTRRATPEQILYYANTLAVFCDFLQKRAPSTTKVFGSTGGASAAICAMMMGESPDYVITLYRQLTLGGTPNMVPVGHSAVRQVLTGTLTTKGGSEGRIDVFVKMLSVFREGNKNNLKLIMRDRKTVLNEVRENLKSWFSTEPETGRSEKIAKCRAAIGEQSAAA